MYERKIQPNLNCGLDLIGEVLYGKWKIRLLWFINEGHQRPSVHISGKVTTPFRSKVAAN